MVFEVLYIIRFILDSKLYLQVLLRGSFLLLASACQCMPAHGARALSSGHQTSSRMSLHTLARHHSSVSIVIMLRMMLVHFELMCVLTLARNHSSVNIVILLRTRLAIFEHTISEKDLVDSDLNESN